MLPELVRTTTRDGVRLEGSFQGAPPGAADGLPFDACCLVHGAGGNFYSSTLFDAVAARLVELGAGVLRINTRGHDLISTAVVAGGGRRIGAAYENVDDCRHDLAAWISFLRDRAGLRLGMIGHSLGAIKCLYAQAFEPDPNVRRIVALSPPRLSHSWFCASPEGPDFQTTYDVAEQHVRAGRPEALLEIKQPLSFVMTAAGFVEKYGPDERYNYLRFASKVACPTLVTLGAVEVASNMAFREVPAELAALGGRLTVRTIAAADHFYTGVRGDLLACLEAWLRASGD